jgi:2Fe-2S ferredoxin
MIDQLISVDRKVITITILFAGDEYAVNTYPGEFRNLMVLINDSIYLDGFGECGGQGRCGTCRVRLQGITNENTMVRNEESTLGKMGLIKHGIRLACQVLITDALDGATITIADEEF